MDETRTTYAVDVGVGRNLHADLVVAPRESDSGVAVVEHVLPPKKLAAPLHRHTREDEISFVVEGRMGVEEDGAVGTVAAGEFAVKGRDAWHTFWNAGSGPLRFFEIIAPGEFAWYFAEAAELLDDETLDEDERLNRLAEVHERYGFEIDYDSVPALLDRHDLER